MVQVSHFDRVKKLTAAMIGNCEKRLHLLLSFPDEQSIQYITPLAPLVQETLEKLKEHQSKSKSLRSVAAKAEYVETSLDILSDLANQVDAFDIALKRTKWGRTQLTLIKKNTH